MEINVLTLLYTAIITAIGSAIGASVYKFISNKVKKRDDKIMQRLDTMQNLFNIFLRYNLQQTAVLDTILDAMKSNHVNGNIDRAKETMNNAKNDLQSEMQEELLKNGK